MFPHFILVCIGGRSWSRNDARNFKLILTLVKAYIFRLHICTCNRCVAISFSIYTVQYMYIPRLSSYGTVCTCIIHILGYYIASLKYFDILKKALKILMSKITDH